MLYSWLDRLFRRGNATVRHPVYRPNRRARLSLEGLEDRLTPSLLLTYGGAGTMLRIAESSSADDTVAISESTPGTLHIDLGLATFDANSSTHGVTYASPGAPGASSSADVSIASAGAIRALQIDLGQGADTLALGMTNAANAVGGLLVSHSGSSGFAAITLNSLALSGDLDVSGGPITVAAGATVTTHGGNLTLNVQGVPFVNGGAAVEIDGATLDSGTNGNINVTGMWPQSDTINPPGAVAAYGIDVRDGAKVQAGGTGTITFKAQGGSGRDNNTGVVLFGAGTVVTTAGGNISITGYGGSNIGDGNDGIDVLAGATVQAGAGGGLTLNGFAVNGVDQNLGVYLDGTGTAVSTAGGNLAITGVGAGSGSQNYGIDVEGTATVRASAAGSMKLAGHAAGDTAAITFNGFHHGSGSLQSGSGAVDLFGDVIDLGGPNSLTSTNGSLIALEATTLGRPVDLGNAVDQSGALTFTLADNAAIDQQGPNAFAFLEIGSSGGISTHADLSFGTTTLLFTFGSPLTGPGLRIANSIDVDGHNLFVFGGPIVVSGASTNLRTHGGFLELIGTGTPGVNGGIGVDINGATLDCGVNGGLFVQGTGAPGTPGTSDLFGVYVHNSAKLQAEGFGRVTLKGTGGNGIDGIGVYLVDANTAVTTADGALSITANGGDSEGGSCGILMANGAVAKATGAGTVTLKGTGGNGTDRNIGVSLIGAGTAVTTADGSLSITGTGTGSGNDNLGIYMVFGVAKATGSGTVTLTGTGGTGTNGNIGVRVQGANDAAVTTAGGDLSITGTGRGSGRDDIGIFVQVGTTVSAGGSGSVTLQGQAPGDTPAITFNAFGDGSGFLRSGGGSVTLTGDVIDLGAPGSITTTGGGILQFQPFTASRRIDLGNATDQANALTFTPTDAAAIAQGAGGFSRITIGRLDSTGLVSTGGDLNFTTSVTIQSPGANSNGIFVSNNLDVAGHDLTLKGGPVLVTGTSTKLSTDGGTLTVTGTGTASVNGGIGVDIDGATLDSGTNGNLTVIGHGATGTPGTSDIFGVFVHNAAKLQAEGFGTVTLNGTGGNGTDFNCGVFLTDLNTAVTTADGALSITANGGGNGGNNNGILMANGAVAKATGTGTVTLKGTSGNGTFNNVGVNLRDPNTAVTTAGGAFSITGTGQGSGSQDFGVIVVKWATLSSGSSGSVTLEGQAPGDTPAIIFASRGLLQSGGTVTLTGDVIDLGDADSITTTGGGILQFQPFTASRPIDLGNATDQANALTFTPTDAAAIAQGAGGFSRITIGRLDSSGLVSTGGDLNFTTSVTIQSPGANSNGIFVFNTLDVGIRHDLTLLGGPVLVAGTSAVLNSHSGTLSITGTGTAAVNGGRGVDIAGGTVAASGSGGTLMVTGTGADGSTNGYGVVVDGAAKIHADGTGTLALNGTGGNGTGANLGVYLTDAGTAVTTADGSLSITANGGGSGGFNYGILMANGAVAKATGTGTLALNGTGGNGTGDNLGVFLFGAGTAVTTAGGALSITGTGRGSGAEDFGILVEASATVRAGGSGSLTLQGQAPGDTPAITFAYPGVGSGLLQSGGGTVTLIGDVIDLGAANSITTTGGGILQFQPFTASRPIDLGNATDLAGALTFTPTDAAAIAQGGGSTGFDTISIGRPDGTGLLRTTAQLSISNANLNLISSEATSAGVIISNSIIVGSSNKGHNLTIDSGPVVVSGPLTKLQTNGGMLAITGMGNTGVNGRVGLDIDAATLDSGPNGNISLTGFGAAGLTQAYGIEIVDGAQVLAGGNGTLTLNGTGGNGPGYDVGVFIDGRNTTIATEGNGAVSITGTGQGSGANNSGIVIFSGLVQASGSGTLTLKGTGANGTTGNVGIFLASDVAGVNSTVQTLGGTLTLQGTGQGSGAGNDGIDVNAGAVAQAGGSAGVVLNGTGTATAGAGYGVHIFSGGRIATGRSASAGFGLVLNGNSTVVAALSPTKTTGFNYTFLQVDTMVDLGGATLQLAPTGTIIPGMTFNLVVSPKHITHRFQGNTITIGGAVYDISYSRNGVTLRRRQ